MQGPQHELRERRRVGCLVRCSQRRVVILLLRTDHRFHRQVRQHRLPTTQHQRLPQAAHAPVAIGEGMDEFELVVEHAAGNQWMGVGVIQPAEQLIDKGADPTGGRCHVYQLVAAIDADIAPANSTRCIHQSRHQQSVGTQQIVA